MTRTHEKSQPRQSKEMGTVERMWNTSKIITQKESGIVVRWVYRTRELYSVLAANKESETRIFPAFFIQLTSSLQEIMKSLEIVNVSMRIQLSWLRSFFFSFSLIRCCSSCPPPFIFAACTLHIRITKQVFVVVAVAQIGLFLTCSHTKQTIRNCHCHNIHCTTLYNVNRLTIRILLYYSEFYVNYTWNPCIQSCVSNFLLCGQLCFNEVSLEITPFSTKIRQKNDFRCCYRYFR